MVSGQGQFRQFTRPVEVVDPGVPEGPFAFRARLTYRQRSGWTYDLFDGGRLIHTPTQHDSFARAWWATEDEALADATAVAQSIVDDLT